MAINNKINIDTSKDKYDHVGIHAINIKDQNNNPIQYHDECVKEHIKFGIASRATTKIKSTDLVYPAELQDEISGELLPERFLDFYIEVSRTDENGNYVNYKNIDVDGLPNTTEKSQYNRKYYFIGKYLDYLKNMADNLVVPESRQILNSNFIFNVNNTGEFNSGDIKLSMVEDSGKFNINIKLHKCNIYGTNLELVYTAIKTGVVIIRSTNKDISTYIIGLISSTSDEGNCLSLTINDAVKNTDGVNTFVNGDEVFIEYLSNAEQNSMMSHDHDGRYYIKDVIDAKLLEKSDNGHTHDDRYYTEGEIDAKLVDITDVINNGLSNKSDKDHRHSAEELPSHSHPEYVTDKELEDALGNIDVDDTYVVSGVLDENNELILTRNDGHDIEVNLSKFKTKDIHAETMIFNAENNVLTITLNDDVNTEITANIPINKTTTKVVEYFANLPQDVEEGQLAYVEKETIDGDNTKGTYIYNGTTWIKTDVNDTNNYVNNVTFDINNGNLTLHREGLDSLSENLDGRYSLMEHEHKLKDITDLSSLTITESQITGFGNYIKDADFSEGKFTFTYRDNKTDVYDLDNRYSLGTHKHLLADITDLDESWDSVLSSAKPDWITSFDNYYVTSADFTNGTLSLTRNDEGVVTVDLTHNHDDLYYTEDEIDTKLDNINGNMGDNYVPYTGATGDVDLGDNNLIVNELKLKKIKACVSQSTGSGSVGYVKLFSTKAIQQYTTRKCVFKLWDSKFSKYAECVFSWNQNNTTVINNCNVYITSQNTIMTDDIFITYDKNVANDWQVSVYAKVYDTYNILNWVVFTDMWGGGITVYELGDIVRPQPTVSKTSVYAKGRFNGLVLTDDADFNDNDINDVNIINANQFVNPNYTINDFLMADGSVLDNNFIYNGSFAFDTTDPVNYTYNLTLNNRDGLDNIVIDLDHNHDDRYYTEDEIDGKLSDINTNVSGNYVPYTDATDDVNLGEHGLISNEVYTHRLLNSYNIYNYFTGYSGNNTNGYSKFATITIPNTYSLCNPKFTFLSSKNNYCELVVKANTGFSLGSREILLTQTSSIGFGNEHHTAEEAFFAIDVSTETEAKWDLYIIVAEGYFKYFFKAEYKDERLEYLDIVISNYSPTAPVGERILSQFNLGRFNGIETYGDINLNNNDINDVDIINANQFVNPNYTVNDFLMSDGSVLNNNFIYNGSFDSTDYTLTLNNRDGIDDIVIDLEHNHDDLYYTESEIDIKLDNIDDNLSDNYVPYTGANKDVNLGDYDLTATTANADKLNVSSITFKDSIWDRASIYSVIDSESLNFTSSTYFVFRGYTGDPETTYNKPITLNARAGTINANGYYAKNKDNTYMLLAGGGTKLLSDLANASHEHTAAEITDFDTEVENNPAVVLNTAKVSNVTTNLSYTASPTNGIVVSSDGTDATIPVVNGTNAGLMTPTMKSKIDGIESSADVNVIEIIKKNGKVLTIEANKSVNIEVPTNLNQLINDNDITITESQIDDFGNYVTGTSFSEGIITTSYRNNTITTIDLDNRYIQSSNIDGNFVQFNNKLNNGLTTDDLLDDYGSIFSYVHIDPVGRLNDMGVRQHYVLSIRMESEDGQSQRPAGQIAFDGAGFYFRDYATTSEGYAGWHKLMSQTDIDLKLINHVTYDSSTHSFSHNTNGGSLSIYTIEASQFVASGYVQVKSETSSSYIYSNSVQSPNGIFDYVQVKNDLMFLVADNDARSIKWYLDDGAGIERDGNGNILNDVLCGIGKGKNGNFDLEVFGSDDNPQNIGLRALHGIIDIETKGGVSINDSISLGYLEDDVFKANIKAAAFETDGGTSSQFVKGDGTLDNNTYLTSYTNNYVTGASFSTSNGVLSLTLKGLTNKVNVDLDGRYLTEHQSLAGYVPYTGATKNVDLGIYDLEADVIRATKYRALNSKTSGSVYTNYVKLFSVGVDNYYISRKCCFKVWDFKNIRFAECEFNWFQRPSSVTINSCDVVILSQSLMSNEDIFITYDKEVENDWVVSVWVKMYETNNKLCYTFDVNETDDKFTFYDGADVIGTSPTVGKYSQYAFGRFNGLYLTGDVDFNGNDITEVGTISADLINVGVNITLNGTNGSIVGKTINSSCATEVGGYIIKKNIFQSLGDVSSTRYYHIADMNANNGAITIQGYMGGHDHTTQGKCNVDLSLASRNSVLGTSGTSIGSNQSAFLRCYKQSNNVMSVYMCLGSWALVNLDVSVVSGATFAYDGTYITTEPTGTKVFDNNNSGGLAMVYDGMGVNYMGKLLIETDGGFSIPTSPDPTRTDKIHFNDTTNEYRFLADGKTSYSNVVAGAFKKENSNDNYMLLGGGGTKLLSDFANASHNHSWSNITSGKPTTLSGYGITDAIQKTSSSSPARKNAVFGSSSSVRIDHIGFDDSTNIYHFVADSAYGTAGNASVMAGDFRCNEIYSRDGKEAIDLRDTWVRINETSSFTGGIYCGSSILRTDNSLQVGGNGDVFRADTSALTYKGTAISLSGHTHSYLPLSGGTLTGDLTVGSTSKASNSVIKVLSNDSHNAGFEAYGNSQGTGYLYVGQSNSYGGGIYYNGDNTPAFASGESSDTIGFYRRSNNTNTEVFYYTHSSSDVIFNGNIYMGSNKVATESFVTGKGYITSASLNGVAYTSKDNGFKTQQTINGGVKIGEYTITVSGSGATQKLVFKHGDTIVAEMFKQI